MHQDQRIGLALGVLLVGACAAFFFRNETRTVPPALRLQHAEELDERIAERTTRPYLKGIEAVEASDRRRQRAADPSHSGDQSPDSASYWSPLNSGGDNNSSSTHSHDRQLRPKATIGEEVVEFAPITVPNELRPASEQITSELHGTSRGSAGAGPGGETRTHVVQKGETLSSIAAKTLGSSSRFPELFEANLDQLTDPNDVKLGMTLRIPSRTEITATPQVVKSRNTPQLRSVPEQGPLELEAPVAPLPTLPAELPLDVSPPSLETPRTLPTEDDTWSISIPIPPQLPSDSVIDQPEESGVGDDANGAPGKFVPSRRTPLPGRPIGPQSKVHDRRSDGLQRLALVPTDSLSASVLR
ncbi:LysM peptidoglycan-binding domain-containing protein [Schlesneria paludicola]|uniref:LysM peptidoglycan-binding domain-containing protein n=1 Tax=Schlesneria paludicola TaxID=360056 RepID=UPI00029B26F0|nr:LysM peptidoglycan-binding domain-containing protein [Schlesneria paludicola]